MTPDKPSRDEESCTELIVANGTVVAVSAASPAKTTPNEDAHALIPCGEQAAILAVADGLGGQAAGETASRMAVDALRAHAPHDLTDENELRPAILNAIEQANADVQQRGVGAATTLSVVTIHGRTLRPYHVGDSMILVVGQRGRIKLQSVAHSPVGYLVEAGALDEGEALHHEDRHVVLNVVGSPDMRIEVGSAIELAPRDTVLLASDGLMDNLYVEEVAECIRTGPLDEAIRRLLAETRRRMEAPLPNLPSKPDDTTIVLFRPTRAGSQNAEHP